MTAHPAKELIIMILLSIRKNSFAFLFSIFRVQIEAFIWDRDSHGLFDYECKTMVHKVLRVTGSCKINT